MPNTSGFTSHEYLQHTADGRLGVGPSLGHKYVHGMLPPISVPQGFMRDPRSGRLLRGPSSAAPGSFGTSGSSMSATSSRSSAGGSRQQGWQLQGRPSGALSSGTPALDRAMDFALAKAGSRGSLDGATAGASSVGAAATGAARVATVSAHVDALVDGEAPQQARTGVGEVSPSVPLAAFKKLANPVFEA